MKGEDQDKERQKENAQAMSQHRAGLEATVRDAIRATGLSAYTLSKRSGVSRQTITRFISGERSLSMDALDRLCWSLDLTLVPKAKKRKAN